METEKVRRTLYNYPEPFQTGNLKISEIHTLAWEVSRNPNGKPVVILHGGPGGGMQPFYRGYFDPEVYKVA